MRVGTKITEQNDPRSFFFLPMAAAGGRRPSEKNSSKFISDGCSSRTAFFSPKTPEQKNVFPRVFHRHTLDAAAHRLSNNVYRNCVGVQLQQKSERRRLSFLFFIFIVIFLVYQFLQLRDNI